ncbi:MAG: hypothetical protein GX442_15380 [Candidatus Riflebacteria bacterium]|nr:hypothetical protein [Candidatus Riflebacteria bacterium]
MRKIRGWLWGLTWLVVLAAVSRVGPPATAGEPAGEVIEKPEFVLYIPDTLDSGRRYPLIVAFSPGADADDLLRHLHEHARTHRCLLFCSKVVRNGMDVPPALRRIATGLVPALADEYPLDPTLIIGTGVSGGGMTAHLFSFLYPNVVAAVISNVGYIHENSLKRPERYPQNKICAFLTSPTDFNFKLMREDEKFLKKRGWTTRWFEFEGGHRRAPDELFDEALGWVVGNLPATAPAVRPIDPPASLANPEPASEPASSVNPGQTTASSAVGPP